MVHQYGRYGITDHRNEAESYARHLVGVAMRICVEKGFHRKTPEVSSPASPYILTGDLTFVDDPRSISCCSRSQFQDLLVDIYPRPIGFDYTGSTHGTSAMLRLDTR